MNVDDFLNFYEESFLEVADCAADLIKKGGSDVVSKWKFKISVEKNRKIMKYLFNPARKDRLDEIFTEVDPVFI